VECLARDPFGERRDTLRLLPVAPQLLVKEDGRKAIDPRFEPRLPILVPEKSCVAEPRREHALGVPRDDLRLLGLHVDDSEKGRLELAVFVHHRKVMLVVDHRRRQHFLG
jgi:hypothetical protein